MSPSVHVCVSTRELSTYRVLSCPVLSSQPFSIAMVSSLCRSASPFLCQDVFKSVERLCEAEGIDCAKFMYRDNTTILDTLEGSRCDTQWFSSPAPCRVLAA